MQFLTRMLVLLGVLAVPVVLAIGSQTLASRPGPPELPETEPVTVSSSVSSSGRATGE